MKTYLASACDLSKLNLEPIEGDIHISPLEKVIDASGKKAMVMCVVSEEHLMQHLWVEIFETPKGWRVRLARGSNIFPTEGTALAVEHVYHAVKKTL